MTKIWIVRSNGGDLIESFTENNLVGLGWDLTPDFTAKNKEFIKEALIKAYPEKKKSVFVWVGYFERFIKSMKDGDYVLTYDKSVRKYYLGRISGSYYYDKSKIEGTPHLRNVKWQEQTLSRDLISISTKNSLGSPQTLFSLSGDSATEILDLFEGKINPIVKDEEVIEEENKENFQSLLENSKEVLKDAIQSLDSDEMEDLMKEVLNAMGYRATRSKKGADRGVDVFASKDGLGLEEPRIFVEVKHRKDSIGAPDIRSFLGGRQMGDKCIFLSTGGFSKEAKYEADRSSIPLTLLDIDQLADLVSSYYDNFNAEGKSLLPLKKVFLPIR